MPFRDINGHVRLVELLARSVARGTLPPSLIFAGPRGVGKRLTATALAQAVNCTAPSPVGSRESVVEAYQSSVVDRRVVDACGACAACKRIARGVHPDVPIVEPGENGTIRIDQVREIIDRAAFRPFEGRRRVVIIDEADALVPAAQNALLKTLEEPPPSSVFVLVTSRPDVLLPTVRSRCIRLLFAAGARAEVDADARDVAERVLGQVGSLGSAADDARRLDAAKELLTKTGAGGAGDREQLSSHLRAMASLLRDVEILATCPSSRAAAGGLDNPEARNALDRLLPAYRGERGVRAFAAVDRALVALERNAGVKVVADWLVLQL